MTKTVVVLGGSYAGLGVAHRLLKNALPSVKDLKVILISKNSHLYWNLASVRAVVPGLVTDDDMFKPIAPGFAQYPSGSAEFLVGSATSVDAAAKTVKVATSTGDRDVSYDYLAIATGSRTHDTQMPWKAASTYEDILAGLHATSEKVGAANHIVVAGAGATGVELCGELAAAFVAGKKGSNKKTVILLSATPEIMRGDSAAKSVERELLKLGVEIRKSTQANSSESLADGKTKVLLADGSSITTDLYLTTTGLVPNSEFLPADWLTEKGFVDVDDEFRVKAVKDVWALGDVVARPTAAWVHTDPHSTGIAKNIEAAINGKPQQLVKGMPIEAVICSTGPNRGAGRLSFIPLPSFLVWLMKGRTLALERAEGYVNGKHF